MEPYLNCRHTWFSIHAAPHRIAGPIGALRRSARHCTSTTGLDDGIFFLTMGEIAYTHAGHVSAAAYIAGRRETYERARAMPPMPTWIKSCFEPFRWAADPRVAAIVTDIGRSLSHAAIVARETGTPVIVGCHTATVRLVTGDRVLVDGRRGIVKSLETARNHG